MAHKGNPYKVQFRRDLHLDLKNSLGYPECYISGFAYCGGAKGSLLTGVAFRSINLLKSSQPPMVWTSEIITVGGFQWTNQWFIDVPTIREGDEGDFRFELTEIGVGVVVKGTCHVNLWNYRSMVGGGVPGTFHYSPGYGPGPFDWNFGGSYADYRSYNP